ncbi:PTS lactose/cellobiose transporter subunit IIA [Pelosinus sp. UFO1]|uniref:PTS lactose/cellobiose transporter subunit IIA n=1 Tax=Pelosinus sp. UFO1 TaxID=484770 RepID=UPI0004D1C8BA|nr:PTS lactose/cellobiose transporter subunit IIA [Pelosinus sp. UFO1]AIF52697.1 phosphotransferase system PTS lactose/cellobiose-specific IIA subunit [Pelosinus sp. UFO1]
MENLEQIAFSLISDAGDAQALMMQALESVKIGDYEHANTLMVEAEEKMHKAHRVQTGLIKKEAEGEKDQCTVLIAHSLDYLMNAMLAKKLVQEIIYLHKK